MASSILSPRMWLLVILLKLLGWALALRWFIWGQGERWMGVAGMALVMALVAVCVVLGMRELRRFDRMAAATDGSPDLPSDAPPNGERSGATRRGPPSAASGGEGPPEAVPRHDV